MLKIENTEVFGWEAAIRGMRNPMNSWDKSDSGNCGQVLCEKCRFYDAHGEYKCNITPIYCDYVLGDIDLKLMKSLSKAGSDHAKFLRMINVTCDITAPRYFWEQFSTYRVGVVQNSTSTMHTIHKRNFVPEDFSWEYLVDEDDGEEYYIDPCELVIEELNRCRKMYEATKLKKYWYQMIQMLPQSYNQKRTVQLNYQVLKSMYFARKDHKLDEWRTLCDWMLTLPYFREVIIQDGSMENN